MKIKNISMKEIFEDVTYYRMWVDAMELPEWIYKKALEMDDGLGYIGLRENQCFEIEGCISNDENQNLSAVSVVYYWDSYENIATLDESEHKHIFEAFAEFASKYGDRMPDNGELQLGDAEYEDIIPQELKDEWDTSCSNRTRKMTFTGEEVVEMLREMQAETAKCQGFVVGHVTQLWVIKSLLGKKIEELGGKSIDVVIK